MKLKKLALLLVLGISQITFAEYISRIKGENENYTYASAWTEWNNITEKYDCTEPTPLASNIHYGDLFEQNYTCKIDQERQRLDNSAKETQTIDVFYTNENVIGTGYFSSCLEILNADSSSNDGVYSLTINSSEFPVYCDMTTNGGGWTLIVAQFEDDPLLNWNEGIQTDYDPLLSTNKSFAFRTNEIPSHSNMAFGQSSIEGLHPSSIYFNYGYTTGNIDRTLLISNYGVNYYIHRNENWFYDFHDPDMDSPNSTADFWNNTLTIDEVNTNTHSYTYAFSPRHSTNYSRGFAYLGLQGPSIVNGAWTIWVR